MGMFVGDLDRGRGGECVGKKKAHTRLSVPMTSRLLWFQRCFSR